MLNKNKILIHLAQQVYTAVESADNTANTARQKIGRSQFQLQSAIKQINDRIRGKVSGTIESKLHGQILRLEEKLPVLDSEKRILGDHTESGWVGFYCSFFGNVFKGRMETCDTLMWNIENQKSQIQTLIGRFIKQGKIKIAATVKEFQQDIRNAQHEFADNWKSALQLLNTLVQEIQKQQPKLDLYKYTPEHLKTAGGFPSGIVFGWWQLTLPEKFRNAVGGKADEDDAIAKLNDEYKDIVKLSDDI